VAILHEAAATALEFAVSRLSDDDELRR
jgi:hypothetical protein